MRMMIMGHTCSPVVQLLPSVCMALALISITESKQIKGRVFQKAKSYAQSCGRRELGKQEEGSDGAIQVQRRFLSPVWRGEGGLNGSLEGLSFLSWEENTEE